MGLTVIFCVIIGLFGVYVCWGLFRTIKKLDNIYDKFESEIVTKQLEYIEDVGEDDISASDYRKVSYDRGKLAENRDNYSAIYADYVAVSQMISIFPLLGIMGTVFGLVLNTTTDVDQLVKGLGMALWTTLIGLVFTVGLKWLDAYFLGRKVNLIDSEFEKAESIIQHQIIANEIRHGIESK